MRYLIVEVFEFTSHQSTPFLVDSLDDESLTSGIRDGRFGAYDTEERKWMWASDSWEDVGTELPWDE